MLDKRCKYKVRETNQFYLFIKYPKAHIFYAVFPMYKKTLSTGETNLKDAYKKACVMFANLGKKKSIPKLNARIIEFLPDVKDYSKITYSRVTKMQQDMQKAGIGNKTIMNYCYILKNALKGIADFEFDTLSSKPEHRGCFPVKSFYSFYQKVTTLETKLAFFSMTTGCRLSEIETCEYQSINGRDYIKINGTKTENAVRTVPALKETVSLLNDVKRHFTDKRIFKRSVTRSGSLCGFDTKYIDENNIVFHSFRRLYKNLLVSCNVPDVYVEYLMGHSMTSNVDRLYFNPEAMDDDEVYPKVIEALSRLL